MKLSKILAFAALVAGSLLAGGSAVQAQDSTPAPTNAPAANNGMRPRGMMNIDRLSLALALTDEEKTNVQAALADQSKQMNELRADTSLSQDDKRAKYRQLRENLNTKLKDILTPEQYTKWLQMAPGRRRPAPTLPPTGTPPTAPNSPNPPAATSQ